MKSAALTYSELHSTYINSKQTTVPPAHHWYEANRPDGSLFLQCSRKEQTILTRFWSGHLQNLTFRDGNKVFPTSSRRATSPFEKLGSEDERWEAPGSPRGVLPQNWGGTELNRTVTCMVLKATANDRRTSSPLQ
ncbi:RNase H domain-containing protein [Trichonephila clavipes]|uniref:RNase H domain-containing protein n=1 Tax=Trichonephila clavipes TaxID=2585209 RepID=A0A8X7BGN7_TRICX|nr:RNase H domain-containing protein [Trichonephila clavipes]